MAAWSIYYSDAIKVIECKNPVKQLSNFPGLSGTTSTEVLLMNCTSCAVRFSEGVQSLDEKLTKNFLLWRLKIHATLWNYPYKNQKRALLQHKVLS